MASPTQTSQPTQPLSPPTTDPTPNNANMNSNNNNTLSQTPSANQNTTAPTSSASAPQPTQIPATSLKDSGKTRRPRDVRLIHMLLASLGVTAYQERVPLQLLDFAYRYTSNVLTDAVHLATEGYAAAAGESGTSGGRGSGGGGGGGGAHDVNTVSLSAMRLSIASRLHYQFQTGLPKEFLMDVATERNRVALPGASRGFDNAGNANRAPQAHQGLVMGGMRLPPERFCLTGVGWDMKEEWESEGEEEIQEPADGEGEGEGDDEGNDDDDEGGKMEDIFGEDTAMGEGEGDEDGDKTMADV